MATEKPKVSAYVPQPIKDKLQDFCKVNDLSESSAVTFILAEYFGCSVDDLGSGVASITADTLKRIDEAFNRLAIVEEKTSHCPLEKIAALEQKIEGLQRQIQENLHPSKDPLNDIFERHYVTGAQNSKRPGARSKHHA